MHVGTGFTLTLITQPKGVECCAEIEAWQCVRASEVGSWHAYNRAPAGPAGNATLAGHDGMSPARARLARLAARPSFHITSPSIMASPCHEDHVRALM